MTTSAGSAQYNLGPFGEMLSASGARATTCPLRFQTKPYDEDLGLYYFGKRWYDPTTRTWLSRDPLREAGGVNVYAYCGGKPYGNYDPIGLATPEEVSARLLAQEARYGTWYPLLIGSWGAMWDLMNPFDPTSAASQSRRQLRRRGQSTILDKSVKPLAPKYRVCWQSPTHQSTNHHYIHSAASAPAPVAKSSPPGTAHRAA